MRMRPESLDELVCNVRWGTGVPLQLMEEGVRGPQDFGAGAPGMEEAWERIFRATERRDSKAEDAAVVDYTRAALWDLWRGYSARRLFTDLYRRADRRQDGSGSADSRRLPTRQEGLWVARELLAEIPATGRFDAERESAALSRVLADQWLPPSY